MSPASYQTAPPRVAVSSSHGPAARPGESGKRDSNPRPQPWQGCALPTELFPRKARRRDVETARRIGVRHLRSTLTFSPLPTLAYHPLPVYPSTRPVSGGEGDRTPDLVNAIHALSQLSYAPCILGPGKTRAGGNTASYRDVQAVSSDFAPRHELFVLWSVSQDDPGPIAMAKHMRRKKPTPPAGAKPRAAPRPTAAAAGQPEPKAKPAKKRGRRRGLLAGLGTHEHERDILDQYLHEVSKTPLLTQKEEIALARKVRAGDQESMQELVKRNLRFVISVAKKYQNRGLPLTDLIGEGNVGLLTAARKFDPDQGVKFISYAVWWIRQAILAALARQGRTVRVPLNRTADLSRIVRTAEYLRQTLRREHTLEEIGGMLGVTREGVRQLRDRALKRLRDGDVGKALASFAA